MADQLAAAVIDASGEQRLQRIIVCCRVRLQVLVATIIFCCSRDAFILSIAMPRTKRGSLSSPNPIKHIHTDDAEAPAVLLHSDVAAVQHIHDNAVKTETLASTMTADVGIDAAQPQLGGSDVTREGVDAGTAAAATMIAAHAQPSSSVPTSKAEHQPPAASSDVVVPPSPVSNRERFMKGFLPARTCCNLDLIRASAGTKFNLAAICIAVFPKSSNPERRYIQLADVTGSVGVTLWNENVNSFSSDSVGRLVMLAKIVITNHNGKKALTMARDSSVQLVNDETHTVSMWWNSLLIIPPLSCGSVHDVSDNSMVSVCGVLGHVSAETKMVQGVPKTLLTLHLVDSSGKLDVRSWNHTAVTFNHLANCPILIRRVRVTSFASIKLCELLDGSGSVVETSFPGDAALRKFWGE